MSTVTALHNNGDSSYDVVVSPDPTYVAFGSEPALLLYSPGTADWQICVTNTVVGDTVNVTRLDSAGDCTKLIVVAAPTTFSDAPPLQIASPIIPAT